MKAVVLTEAGHASANFELRETAAPEPGDTDVLLTVRSVSERELDP